jgi:UDP-N-acetylmuramate: L-alanyl-gamma-D-glutamyl-meso-diaminopimelate ligase
LISDYGHHPAEIEATLEAARRGLPTLSMPQAVAEYFIGDLESIVVAGTHGKTTTTALMAGAFSTSGRTRRSSPAGSRGTSP